jgi:putative DNA primase/helicase
VKRKEISIRDAANQLREMCPTACDKSGTLWVYDDLRGIWINNGLMHLEKLIRKGILPVDQIYSYMVKEIIADVKAQSHKNKDFPVAPPEMVPFNDCVVDIRTGEVMHYKPELFMTSKLPINFNPEAKCPLIEQAFGQLLPQDKVIDLYELAAYCMFRGYPYQKMFFLYGRGANGKGVFTRVLEALLGKHNISTVSMKNFQNNRFSGAELHNRYANICSELDYSELRQTDLIKQLTGGDSIQAEKKFQHPFKFINHAKLIFVTNELPRTIDKTEAFYRRIHVIEFPFVFDGEKADRFLLEKICVRCELEGLAAKCLGILKEMYGRGMVFTNDGTTESTRKQYEGLTNQLETFIAEYYRQDLDGYVAKQDFKTHFEDWLQSNGHRIWTEKRLSLAMKDLEYESIKKLVNGKGRQNCWQGLRHKVEVKS